MRAIFRIYAMVIVGCTLMVFGLFPMLPAAYSQETVFDYLEQAHNNLVAQSAAANTADYDCFTNGNCLFGVYLAKGSTHSVNAHFEKDVKYLVLGAGDDRVIDLDLSLFSSSGVPSLQDNDDNAIPVLQFTPDQTGEMRLNITNVDSLGDGFGVMLILEENFSGSFPLDQITEAFDNVVNTPRTGDVASSRFARDTFCLFGGRLREGEANFLYNARPEAGSYALFGAGSNNITDVDVFIYHQQRHNSTYGRLMARDAESDNRTLCSFAIESGHYYLFEHKNRTSQGNTPGFVVSVLLRE